MLPRSTRRLRNRSAGGNDDALIALLAALKQLRIPEPTLGKLAPGPSNKLVVVVEGCWLLRPSGPTS